MNKEFPENDEVLPVAKHDAEQDVEQEPELTIEGTPEFLGFIKTPELQEVEKLYIEACQAQDAEAIRASMIQWTELAEKIVEEHGNETFARAQLGASLAQALLRREGGQPYLGELVDLIESAYGLREQKVMEAIEAVLAAAQE